jgi:integrase
VGLKAARERRDEARKALAAGIDPSAKRKAESATQTSDTFEAIAREFLETKRKTLFPSTWQRDCDQLEQMIFPYLGSKPVAAIEAPDLLAVLRRIEARGAHDTAHRARVRRGLTTLTV